MSRRIALMVFVVLVLNMLALGKGIEFWMVGWGTEMAKIAQGLIDSQFTPETGIEAKIRPLAWGDYYTKSLMALASGDTPDIFSLGSEIADFALRGGLIDLAAFKPNEYASLEKELFSSVMGPFSFEARRFALPIDVAALVGVYRYDLLNEMGMGIPKTWEELISYQPKALAKGKTFAFMNFDEIWAAYTVITQNGGQFFGADGFTSALDKPESVNGFIEYVELFTKHKLPLQLAGPEPFIRGDQLSYVDGLWAYPTLSAAAPNIAGKWRVDVVPGIQRNGQLHYGSSAGSVLLGISASSKRKEEAWKFLKWFLSEGVLAEISNTILAKMNGWLWLPANKKAMQKVNLPIEVRDVYFRQIEACIPVPYAVNALVQYRYVHIAIQKSILQKENPREAILEAAKEMNSEMARRKKEYNRFLTELAKRDKVK